MYLRSLYQHNSRRSKYVHTHPEPLSTLLYVLDALPRSALSAVGTACELGESFARGAASRLDGHRQEPSEAIR